MACLRCGTDNSCACSGLDWRQEVANQVRAHRIRKRRRVDSDSPQFEFTDSESVEIPENSTMALRASRWRENTFYGSSVGTLTAAVETAKVDPEEPAPAPPISAATEEDVAVPRPPLAPFPRITAPAPKIIEFPRAPARSYELAEPVADQLTIFEATEELPPPTVNHLSAIEIAPEEAPQTSLIDSQIPVRPAPLGARCYSAAVDAAIILVAAGVFAVCGALVAGAFPVNKALMASGAASLALLVTIYYVLSLCFGNGTPGMQASGLCVLTFPGATPSRATMCCRALTTVLSAASLGMGFGWALIDEDQLCWHDRITHTYLKTK
jgi:uncharacterized RDD family membrane protein YckC